MPRYVTTPWQTPSELVQLRDRLYSFGGSGSGGGESDHRRAGINQALAWRERGDIPLAIEATILLTEAFLHDDSNVNSTFAIRAMYASAISRFVTGFCDTIQDAATKSSMHEMAALLGLPAHFVEVRHEATHQGLPSLNRLRQVAQESLAWLWGWYWGKLDQLLRLNMDGTSSSTGPYHGADGGAVSALETATAVASAAEQLRATLKTFQSRRRTEIKADPRYAKQVSEAATTAHAACMRLCKNQKAYVERLIVLLVDEKAIIPSDRQLGSSMNGAFLFWDVLLRKLASAQPHFLPLLVSRMVTLMCGHSGSTMRAVAAGLAMDDGPFQEALHDWLVRVLTSKSWATTVAAVPVVGVATRNSSNGGHVHTARTRASTKVAAEVDVLPKTVVNKSRIGDDDDLINDTLTTCFIHPTAWSRQLATDIVAQRPARHPLQAAWAPMVDAVRAAVEQQGGNTDGEGEKTGSSSSRDMDDLETDASRHDADASAKPVEPTAAAAAATDVDGNNDISMTDVVNGQEQGAAAVAAAAQETETSDSHVDADALFPRGWSKWRGPWQRRYITVPVSVV